jgi:glycerol uptake facilitator-like aquaporin
MVNALGNGVLGQVGTALAFAFVVIAMIYALGHLSGAHINPAVTIGFWSVGRFPTPEVLPYIAAQCVGAVLASALSRAALDSAGQSGATLPQVSPGAAFGIEWLLSFVVMFVIVGDIPNLLASMSLWVSRGPSRVSTEPRVRWESWLKTKRPRQPPEAQGTRPDISS